MTTKTSATVPTDQEIAAAEREFAEADQKLAGARAHYAQVRFHEGVDYAVKAVSDARWRYDVASGVLTALREARERAQQVEVRRALEKSAAKDLKRRADELASSRDGMVSALHAAQQALVAAITAVQDHNARLGECAGELAAAGFDGISDDYQAGSDPRGRIVVLDGNFWREVDTSVMLAQLVERTRMARLDPGSFDIRVRRFERGHAKHATAAKVLALVPCPQVADTQPGSVPSWGRSASSTS